MDRSRRALLSALGAALAAPVAGCSDAGSAPATAPDTAERTRTATGTPIENPTAPRTDTATPTEFATRQETATRSGTAEPGPVALAPGESYTASGGWSLTVERVAVTNAVVEFGTTHWNPRWSENGQIVAADLVVSSHDAPDPADLHVTFRTDAGEPSGRFFVAAESNRDDRRQRVGFEVPSEPAPSAGAIVWTPERGPEVRWSLSDAHLAAVARPPDLRLERFEVADVSGEDVEVTLTVANGGAGHGVFLAEVGDAAMSDQPEVAVEVPAGETHTATRRVWANGADGEATTILLRWRGKRLERTVGSGTGTTTEPRTVAETAR